MDPRSNKTCPLYHNEARKNVQFANFHRSQWVAMSQYSTAASLHDFVSTIKIRWIVFSVRKRAHMPCYRYLISYHFLIKANKSKRTQTHRRTNAPTRSWPISDSAATWHCVNHTEAPTRAERKKSELSLNSPTARNLPIHHRMKPKAKRRRKKPAKNYVLCVCQCNKTYRNLSLYGILLLYLYLQFVSTRSRLDERTVAQRLTQSARTNSNAHFSANTSQWKRGDGIWLVVVTEIRILYYIITIA